MAEEEAQVPEENAAGGDTAAGAEAAAEGGDQDQRQAESYGVKEEQAHSLEDGFIGSSQNQDSGKDGPDAGGPSEREGGPKQKKSEKGGCGFASKIAPGKSLAE